MFTGPCPRCAVLAPDVAESDTEEDDLLCDFHPQSLMDEGLQVMIPVTENWSYFQVQYTKLGSERGLAKHYRTRVACSSMTVALEQHSEALRDAVYSYPAMTLYDQSSWSRNNVDVRTRTELPTSIWTPGALSEEAHVIGRHVAVLQGENVYCVNIPTRLGGEGDENENGETPKMSSMTTHVRVCLRAPQLRASMNSAHILKQNSLSALCGGESQMRSSTESPMSLVRTTTVSCL